MERRHDELLTSRLEDAWKNGVSHITWPELYLWYSVEKLAARSYRDLCHRWDEMTNGEAGSLMSVKGRDGIFIFGQKTVMSLDPDR